MIEFVRRSSSDQVLLVDPEDPMVEEKQAEIYLYCAHEIAHQWTGNLVTTAWWDTIWLNEGITEFFTYFSGTTVNIYYRFSTAF